MNSTDVFSIKRSLELTEHGVPLDQCCWPRVTLSSTNLVCTLHNEGRSSSEESMYSATSRGSHVSKVQIIQTNGKVISRSKTIAESAKIHPSRPIIALKAFNHCQVYNFETKHLLNETDLRCDVCYWKWADDDTIIFITDTALLQWAVFTESSEVEVVCNRLHRLRDTEVVNCSVDEYHRWYAVTGLCDRGQDSLIEGRTQIYSADYGVSQCIEAHAVTFITYKFDGNLYDSIVLCAASRLFDSRNGKESLPRLPVGHKLVAWLGQHGSVAAASTFLKHPYNIRYENPTSFGYAKVHSIELGPALIGNAVPRFNSSDLKFSPNPHRSDSQELYPSHCADFPVSIQADKSHCVVYILTKYGQLYIAELESALVLTMTQICSDITFCLSLDSLSSITVVSRSSQVYSVTLDWLLLIKHVKNNLGKVDLANRLQNSKGMENVDLLQIS